jgi:aspartate aminotransferase
VNNDKEKIAKDKKLPISIRTIVRMYPSNQANRLYYGGLPHIGNALWGAWSSDEVQKAAEAYENYSLSTNLLIKGLNPPASSKIRLGGGSPAKFQPFKQCLVDIESTIQNRVLSDYPLAAGDDQAKLPIIAYYDLKYSKKISENNIIFTHSSTHAFTLVMEAILDYGDVVLMTAPNYGLFTFIPERVGGRLRLLELSAKDDWKINPKKLKKLIDEINIELKADYDRNRGKYIFRRSDLAPKISAFVNYNPHNPTGVVYSKKDEGLLQEISSICKDSGIFVVDDLAYSGLEYDRKNIALPICSLEGHFDNTITLYTLSKSYGLAGLRSGMIVANEIVSSYIRDRIFQASDSLSILQSSAMSTVFKIDEDSQAERAKYFSYITQEYYKRFIFVKGIVSGFDSLKGSEVGLLDSIIQKNNLIISLDSQMSGINSVSIVIEPQSGFFVLLDLTKLIGKSYKGFKINDDKSLLQFLYTADNIKVLTGNAFCWTDGNQLIIRATIAQDYKDILDGFLRLKTSIELLED